MLQQRNMQQELVGIGNRIAKRYILKAGHSDTSPLPALSQASITIKGVGRGGGWFGFVLGPLGPLR